MTTQRLEAKKAMLAREVLNIENEEMANKLIDYIGQLKEEEKAPCQFTVEELKEEVEKSMKQAEQGLGYTTEEIIKLRPQWK
ncbi:hypothetical protein [uncultured Bacteroides sp.]|uniref:hypothetical protein n=1 Tax=uncultured Bacteroides sp. TaxID=162156 RepID=UPI002AA748B1|nr:hypothetical protein [uncultured Bacteroides sp.]